MADVLPSDELIDVEPSDFGSLRPGTRLGRYELLLPIARGGMARVWAARQHGQRGFQKLVAIKTILPHLADEPEFERMFLDEARIASGVHHPNVCEIYELGEERRTLYLAMEWVSGDSLSRLLRASGKTESIDPRVAARIIADACAGVHAAHELTDEDGRQLGVVHRDMSPHNVLLSADGNVKVCDFGVAKALGQLHEQTSAGQLKGKISYMSPEQITGNAIDRRSDVFSLGCVLYEATTGVRPFKGERDHQIMHAVMQGELTPPSHVVRSYPPDLERIVMRALAHQPILRYPTAERMRFALEEFLTKGPQVVTTTHAAQVVRARLGEQLERRKERIKQAQSVAEQNGWDPAKVAPTRDAQDHRSGVKPAQNAGPAPGGPPPPIAPKFAATMQMVAPKLGNMGAPPAPNDTTTGMPPTPRMTPAALGGPPRPSGSMRAASVPTPTTALTTDNNSEDTMHGHGLPPSASTIPQAPRALEAAAVPRPAAGAPPPPPPAPPNPMGGPTLTLPIGPGGMMSPLAHHPHQPSSDYSSPGAPPMGASSDWSSPGVAQTAAMATTLPPGSSGPASHPYNNHYEPNPTGPLQPIPPSDAHPVQQRSDGEKDAGAGSYLVAAFVGLLFAVLIGGGGFFVWHTRTTAAPPAPTFQQPPPSTAPTSSTSSPASAEIALKITPPDATVVVDGRELPSDARAIARPAAGQTMTLLVKAKGHEDTSVAVDFFSQPELVITMKPILEIDTAGSASPSASAAASSSAKHSKPRPRDPNAIPDNPY